MITYTVIVDTRGTRAWYLNGNRHREDGPAVEHANGTKAWYLNDKRHRVDGPAIEYPDGRKHWYLNGEILSEEEFNQHMSHAVELTVADIEKMVGRKVKIVKE